MAAPETVVTNPDPTENVKELVVAANIRADDLRLAEARRVNEQIKAANLLTSELIRSIRREAELRAAFSEKLATAESNRIDAIRLVDVNGVAIANERATAQATVLANELNTAAETNRQLVATTASNIATQLATLTSQLTDRISQLERSSYEGQGKSTATDPMMARLVEEMAALRNGLSKGEGRSDLSTPLLVTLASAAVGVVVYLADHVLK